MTQHIRRDPRECFADRPYPLATHDVELPGSSGEPIGFLMYPQAETADGRIDCLDPDNFKYEITSTEV